MNLFSKWLANIPAPAGKTPAELFEELKVADKARDYGRCIEIASALLSRSDLSEAQRLQALAKRGRSYLESGEDEPALADCDAVLAVRPNSADTLFNQGIARFHMRQFSAALESFDLSARIVSDAVIHVWRGAILVELREWKKARYAFDDAIRLDRSCIAALRWRMHLREKSGDLIGALEDCCRAIDALALKEGESILKDEALKLLERRASLHDRLKNFEQVIEDADVYLLLQPDHPPMLKLRAKALASTGLVEGALKDHERLVALAPEDFQIRKSQINCLYEAGQTEAAEQKIVEFLRLFPGSHEAHDLAERIHAFIARDNGTLYPKIDEAIWLNPRDIDLRQIRADTLLDRREYRSAIADYDAILRRQPKHLLAWRGRARAHLLMGERNLAIADIQRALALEPGDAAALGMVREIAGV